MGLIDKKINKLLAEDEKQVYCFYSTEDYLLNSAAKKMVLVLLSDNEAEFTKIDGPQPSIEEAVSACGTISFFGTKRVVQLNLIEPSTMPQADIDALCDLMGSLENACLILTCILKDDKAKSGKKVKQIIDNALKYGVTCELSKMTNSELREIACAKAAELGAKLNMTCASLLVDRCANDAELIENEVAKLAATSNYSDITQEIIMSSSTLNIEADVFEMVRFVSTKNKTQAFETLNKLFQLQNDPVAITAALSSSFIDVYRVKCAAEIGKSYSSAFKDYVYTGSDYRLKKSSETASRYSKKQLFKILKILLELDLQLKSSPVDNVLLLQTAICEILNTGANK